MRAASVRGAARDDSAPGCARTRMVWRRLGALERAAQGRSKNACLVRGIRRVEGATGLR